MVINWTLRQANMQTQLVVNNNRDNNKCLQKLNPIPQHFKQLRKGRNCISMHEGWNQLMQVQACRGRPINLWWFQIPWSGKVILRSELSSLCLIKPSPDRRVIFSAAFRAIPKNSFTASFGKVTGSKWDAKWQGQEVLPYAFNNITSSAQESSSWWEMKVGQ